MGLTPAPRFPLDFPVIILKASQRESSKPIRIEAQSLNLSQTGLGLLIPESARITEGDVIGLQLVVGEFAHRRGSIPIAARVIWRNGSKCGVQILRIREDISAMYASVISGYQTLAALEVSAEA